METGFGGRQQASTRAPPHTPGLSPQASGLVGTWSRRGNSIVNLVSGLVLDPEFPARDRSDGDPGLQVKGEGHTLIVEVPHPQTMAKAEIYTFVCPSDLMKGLYEPTTDANHSDH